MPAPELLLLIGTRAEAVKVAPVALAAPPTLRTAIVHSGQHGTTVDSALASFGLGATESLVPWCGGGQADLMSVLLPAIDRLIARRAPAAVLVQGDTTTALAGALAAHWRQVPLVHLEAGLRTGSLRSPFPEEANRQLIARLAALHLAPTVHAASCLHREALIHPNIVVTGNTVVDAVRLLIEDDRPTGDLDLATLERTVPATGGRLALVTAHRRESWGTPLAAIFTAVAAMADDHPDLHVLLPTHPNPAVREQAHTELGGHPRVVLSDPLDYPACCVRYD